MSCSISLRWIVIGMYKVLLVDDERIVRVGLQSIIKWQEETCELVGVVQDGKQALNQVEKNKPDIIITDLNMPVMDGITLIKKLKETDFQGEIIVLTNYGEFELAREALRYGVHDYLLKATLTPQELSQTLKAIKLKLDKKCRENKSVAPNIFEQITSVDEVDQNHIQATLLSYEEACDYKIQKQHFKKTYTYIMISKLDSKYDLQNIENNPLSFYKESIQNIIKEMTDLDRDLMCIWGNNKALCVMTAEKFEDKNAMEQLSVQIGAHIRMYTNIKVATAIGETFTGTVPLYASIEKCDKTLEHVFYRGYKAILRQEDADKSCRYIKINADKFMSAFREAIGKGDSNEALKLFYSFVDKFEEDGISVEDARHFLDHLMNITILDYGMYFEHYKEQLKEISIAYRKCILLGEIKEVMSKLVYTICNYVSQVKDVHYRKEVQDIIDYIQNNINKRITLASIAEEVNMNESYISRLFKNETGNNIVNYINMIKMERAKELLKNPDNMIKDVANSLGFEEQSYFNKMFKKYFGITPNDYKKS
ncbi:MAG: response regulator [Cellulosilyticaceae bacterium]